MSDVVQRIFISYLRIFRKIEICLALVCSCLYIFLKPKLLHYKKYFWKGKEKFLKVLFYNYVRRIWEAHTGVAHRCVKMLEGALYQCTGKLCKIKNYTAFSFSLQQALHGENYSRRHTWKGNGYFMPTESLLIL